jgi:hypothetical protein
VGADLGSEFKYQPEMASLMIKTTNAKTNKRRILAKMPDPLLGDPDDAEAEAGVEANAEAGVEAGAGFFGGWLSAARGLGILGL